MKKAIFLVLFMFLFASCNNVSDINFTENTEKSNFTAVDLSEEVTDISLNIFEQIYSDDNVLISPLSIISAVSMVANGTEGETLKQIEDAFGIDISNINEYLLAYSSYMPSSNKYKFSSANSIWIKDDYELNNDFLQKVKYYYSADIFSQAFDKNTKDDINKWINKKTDGMIKEALDTDISSDSVMYLVNALSFDAQWKNAYKENRISSDIFTNSKGESQTVDFMASKEEEYIEFDNAIGFSKYYADSKYSFVAILPNEGVSIEEFIGSVSGEDIVSAYLNRTEATVYAYLPKFSFEYNTGLVDALNKLGITDAFDGNKANFGSLLANDSDGLFISDVIHNTKIEVNEAGTKAGASTAVEMVKTSDGEGVEPKIIKLDRPFFFAVVDDELGMPVFMGVLNNANHD